MTNTKIDRSIPRLARYKHVYLTKVTTSYIIDHKKKLRKTEVHVCINELNTGICRELTLHDIFSPQSDLTVKMTRPKRISREKAAKLLQEGVRLITRHGGEMVIPV